MKAFCLICSIEGMDCPGRMHDGWPHYALCSEHHSHFMRRAQEAPPVRVVTLPLSAEDLLLQNAARAVLDAAEAADRIRPPNAPLQ
jgi:hypothetical protein